MKAVDEQKRTEDGFTNSPQMGLSINRVILDQLN